MADPEISRFPHKERPYMPGSKTTPGLAGTRNDAPASVAFRGVNNVGTRVYNAFAAQWYAPLPTLRSHPRGGLRTDRGRRGLLLLHRSGLSPHTPCRSPGALTRVAARRIARSPSRDRYSKASAISLPP